MAPLNAKDIRSDVGKGFYILSYFTGFILLVFKCIRDRFYQDEKETKDVSNSNSSACILELKADIEVLLASMYFYHDKLRGNVLYCLGGSISIH